MTTAILLRPMSWALFLAIGLVAAPHVIAATPLRVEKEATALSIFAGEQPIAVYVWADEAVPRPYFKGLTTPDGLQVTRNYPTDPVLDRGNDDHAHFHPGAWLAFGDINGVDFWRNKARVRHLRFVTPPRVHEGAVSFTVENSWETGGAASRLVTREQCTYTVRATRNGYLLTADSTFSASDDPVVFGDQEEMGFGVRVATPLRVHQAGGRLINSNGGEKEAETWGRKADWCAGYGTIDGQWVGVNVMAAPENFRPAWFHSRDYGLIVANPFGKKAMTGPRDPEIPPDRTVVEAGETLRLQFGLYVFSTPASATPDLAGMYETFVEAVRE